MKSSSILSFISSKLSGKKHVLFLLSAIQTLLGVVTVAFAFTLRYVIKALEEGSMDSFIRYFVVLSCFAVSLVALQVFYRFQHEHALLDIEKRLRDELYDALIHSDYSYIKSFHEEEWIHRLSSDIHVISNNLLSILPSLCRMVTQLVLALAAITYLYWAFGLVLIPCVLVLLLFTYFLRKRLKELHKQAQEKEEQLKSFYSESLQGLSIIHGFAKQDIFSLFGKDKTKQSQQARLKQNYFAIACSIGYIFVYYLAYLLGVYFAGKGIIEGTLSIALLTALIALLGQLTGPLGNLTSIVPKYYSLLASGERIRLTVSEGKALSKEDTDRFYEEEFKSLEIQDVTYSYMDRHGQSKTCLNGFSLSIRKGQKVLLYGRSGIGKSTLLKLMLGLYAPEGGEVYLLGKEKKEPKEYTRLYGYVPQENLLMQGSIEEAVALGEEANRERFEEALRLSESYDFVNELPSKEKTLLKEKGSGLSLGQLERLAIARALYADAPILLLDECCASLDEKTEEKVMENLLKLDKTIVCVSHHSYDPSLFDQVVELGE